MRLFYDDIPLSDLKSKYCNEHSRFVRIQDMDVHYRDEGSGPPLVLIHGTGASLHTWDAWVEQLADKYRLIRLDLPGFGLTGPHPNRCYRMESYCAFLEEFAVEIGLDSFHMAGSSLGGRIAWSYAVRFPSRINKLVLIAASGYPLNISLMIFKIAQIPVVKTMFLKAAPFGGVAINLRQCFVDKKRVDGQMVKRYHQLLLREGNRRALIDRIRQEHTDEFRKIPKVQAPTLILWGEKDQVVPAKFAHRFHHDIKNTQLIVYDNVGHLPMEEIASQSASDLHSFLSVPWT